MKDEVEKLVIYNSYTDMAYYSYQIMRKFPNYEIYGLQFDIKEIINNGIDLIICAQMSRNFKERLEILYKLDAKLKSLKFYIRLAYKFKYITGHNYGAWSRKITNVSLMLGGWIKSCQKH